MASLILITGFGGLLGYDLYFKPYVLSGTVVKVKAAEGYSIPRNHELRASDLYLDSVQTKDIPAGAVTDIGLAENKLTNVSLTDGTILTESLIDAGDLEPKAGEGIFPVPKEAIYAINGSLRSRDKVDIYVVELPKSGAAAQTELEGEPLEQPGNTADDGMERRIFLEGVTVNYVRSEDNNDVLDTEYGNNNNRITSTGKVTAPELKLTKEDGMKLKAMLEQGMKLWIVRVN